jgi:acyl-CoA synthetase (AMP-forming)/AMP-acid ligase II
VHTDLHAVAALGRSGLGSTAFSQSKISDLAKTSQPATEGGEGGVTDPLVIGDVFRNAARATPHRTAAALGEDALSFAAVDAAGDRTAQAFSSSGIGRGDRVATWADTTLSAVPVFVALAKLGAVFAPLNALWGEAEVADALARCRPALLLVDAARARPARALAQEAGIAVLSFEELASLAASSPAEDPCTPVGEEEPHVVFFTSGSSGAPKGAVLSHRANVLRSLPGALLEPRGAMVCPYPLFHMGAWTIALQQWQARDAVIFVSTASADEIGAAVERHRATRLNAIPAVWRRLLDVAGDPDAPDLSSLRFADTGTSATPPELLRAIAQMLPAAQVRVFYGSTEAGGVTVLEHVERERKPGSCGVPGPLVSIRTDGSGQLFVRGPLLFDGYLDDAAATTAALVEGWYATGDLAEVDEDGFVSIVGRVGEVIRTGGESVAPSELEAVLAGHPRVADIAVVGLPDERWGELVCAVVVPAPDGPPPELAELRAHCVGALATYKFPRRLAVVEQIPRTPATGQVQRRLLQELVGSGRLQNSVLEP